MKIVVIGTRGIPHIQGGVEKHCEHLYPCLAKMGYDVTVMRRSCYVEDNLSEYEGVKLKNVYAPRNKTFEAILHTFLAVIEARKMNPAWLHIHAIGPSIFVPFARILGLKVVVTHHGPDYDRQKWNKIAKFFLRLGERCGVKYSNELIVISKVIDDIVRKKYNRNDAHIIFNGVMFPAKSVHSQYIADLGLEKGKYILTVGRFVQEKGFDLLIEAFSRLKNSDMKLVLAGDSDHPNDYSQKLKKQAEENGVVMTGFISGEKLNEVYSHARLFVLPSFHEGLPISLLEAMSYDLDVLVSDIPANKEVQLPEDSYFLTGDICALTNGLQEKLTLGSSFVSKKYDMTRYDWDKIALQVHNIYKFG